MKKAILYLSFSISLILSISISAMAGPVPDTGQTTCYDNSVVTDCPQPGEDFYGQDAQYTINPPSYTKLDANGNDLSEDATSWVMVRDNVTGLIWEVKTDDGSIHDKDNYYTWCDNNPDTNGGNAGTCGDGTDTEDFINALNASKFGGFSDWRLPTIKELFSIVNKGAYDPAINTEYFPNTVSGHWSFTTYAGNTLYAWLVYFQIGRFNYNVKSNALRVRAVRGGQPDMARFVVNGDGTVTDPSTGLMWQQGGAESMNWESDISYCENLTLAGYDDWRLPNINELQSIADYSKSNPAIDMAYFPNTVSSVYRSSTTFTDYAYHAWLVDFNDGYVDYGGYGQDKSSSYYVRAVRSGQNRLLDHLLISAPQQASTWQIGKEQLITWETKDIQGNVRITLSRQGGKPGTFETIAENTENDGAYLQTVTGPASLNCILKIEPIDEPDRSTSEGLFGIDELYQTFVTHEPLAQLQTYRLSLMKKYKLFGYRRVETFWSVSDNTVATIDRDVLTALKNGCVVASTTYDGQEYSQTVYFKTEFDQWEMESNNTAGTATQLSECRFIEGELLLDDTDFFKVYLPTAATVEISYFSSSQTADVRVEIFDNADNLLDSAVSNNGESLTFPLGLNAGNYYLKLTSAGDIDQIATYDLVYKTIAPLPASGIINIPVGGSAQGIVYHLQDKRTFSLSTEDIDKRQGILIDFFPSAPNADYHITVLNSVYEVVGEADSTGGNYIRIDAIRGGGSYTIEVIPIQTIDAESPFTIDIMVADYFVEIEPNDTTDVATAFDAGETIKGKLGALTDIDFYALRLEAPVYLALFFECPDSEKDFIISVYKDSDQNLINSITSTAGEAVTLPMGLNIGRYYLKVTGSGTDADTDHLYTLSLSPSSQTNLEIESNNTAKFATPICKEDGRQGRIFSGDDVDYYGFNLPELTFFNIDFTPFTATGDYKISLVDKDDQVFYYKTSTNGEPMTLKANRPPGNYYVKVQANGDVDQHNDYVLVLTADAIINPGHAIDGLKTLVSISITAESDQMEVDEAIQLTAVGNYSDASSEPLLEVLWSSLDPDVGSVAPNGLVSGIAGGEAIVVAVYGGLVGQIKLKVGSPVETFAQRYGNLIIVAGSGGDESDPFTQSAQYLCDLVYKRFQNRLFRDEDIYYFNTVSWHDIDGDGYDNNVVDDDSPTVNEFSQAITGWAANQSTDGPLYIYMVGHGEIDTFNFSYETITAIQLKGFIDTFQNATERQVVVIIEACKSGSFTDDLVSQDEDLIVVTSTDDQDAYLRMGGRISFSQFFMDYLHGGDSVYQSLLSAKSELSGMESPFNLMHPQLAEGITMASNQTWLGGDFVVANLFPGWVCGKVYDASTGISIENATVYIEIENTTLNWGVNTLDGGYYLCQVPAGTYKITATVDGYLPAVLTDVGVGLGDRLITNFEMTPLDGDSEVTYGSGWNLISLLKQPEDTDIATVLESISGKYISVWAYIDGSWKVYDPNNPGFSDLTTMEAGRGYWINMTEAGSFNVMGSAPTTSCSLASGWNLVGYNSSTSQSVADALTSIAGKYASVWAYMNGNWKVYDPNNPGFSDLEIMEPGYGYWINATETCTWTLP